MTKNILLILLLCTAWDAHAQSEISTIRIQDDTATESIEASGFNSIAEKDLPMSLSTVNAKKIEENSLHRLSDITLLEASVTDSYNAAGYWDYLSVRGFTLDNRYNYQREGLPISAETSIALDNKERIEILHGLNGLQSGAASPGGSVNYVVKRPTEKPLREIRTELSNNGNLLAAVDAGGRVESRKEFGYRLNLAHEDLHPALKKTSGQRTLAAFAGDWRINSSTLLETEVEWSHRSQPSQAGFSLLGDKVPSPTEPDLNLNNQPWTEPVVFQGFTGSVRFTRSLTETPWSWSVTAGAQDLTTDDRLAYPYGCTAESRFDRYCSDGTYDLYDYRSEGESRKTYAGKTSLQGTIQTSAVTHQLSVGMAASSLRERYQRQAYNYAGIGNVEGTAVGTPDPALTEENTNRDAAVRELFLSDAASWKSWKGWLGLRYTNLERSSVRTDGSRPTDYTQNFATPWLALSYDFTDMMAYASYGQGLESYVTPNKDGYDHRGEFLSDVISRQIEVGLRGKSRLEWSVSVFEIHRPTVTDQKPSYEVDGEAVHRGLELQASYDQGAWQLGGSFMKLHAERQNAVLDSSLNGKRPVNVPEDTLRLQAGYKIPGVPGLALQTRLSHEGERAILPDNSLLLPAWTRWDAGVSYAHSWEGARLLWRLSVDNITDEHYWRESPTQYGHVYLYPGDTRSVFLSLQASL